MNSEISEGAEVELCPGFESVYSKATAGALATVQEVKEDEFGFPLVYVEWEKNHWAYAGQADGWTFANHFRLYSENDLICDAPADYDIGAEEQYIDAIMDAFDEAAESQGFILVAIRDVSSDAHGTVYSPIVLAAAITDEAAQILKELGNPLEEE